MAIREYDPSTLIEPVSMFQTQQYRNMSVPGQNMSPVILPENLQNILASPYSAIDNTAVTAPAQTPSLNTAQQQSLGQWVTGNIIDPVKGFLGFNNQTPQLQFLDPTKTYTPAQKEAIQTNNQALSVGAQQSLAKWNAFGNVIQGVGGLANAYIGLEQLDLAKDAAKFTREAYQTNLRNQTRDYNTQLQERRKRYLERTGGYSDDALKNYMDKHGL